MTCAEAAACVGRLPVGVVSTRRRGCLRPLIKYGRRPEAGVYCLLSLTQHGVRSGIVTNLEPSSNSLGSCSEFKSIT